MFFTVDAFIVSVNTLILFDGRVKRHPAISRYAELSVELALSVAAQHLSSDYGLGVVCFSHLRNHFEEFRIDSGNYLVV